mgnify:CR=1 FL=1
MGDRLKYDEYPGWFQKNFNFELSKNSHQYYDSVSSKMKSDLEESKFWESLLNKIPDTHFEYQMEKKYPLVIDPHAGVKVFIKPYSSFIEKTYRINVLQNQNFPKEPDKGWVTPDNWFHRVRDILRTQIAVKYLDGVEFVSQRITELCIQHNQNCSVDFEARQEGYYAAHLSIEKTFEIPKMNWDTYKTNAFIEIQVTTQIQEVIKKLLHTYYESRRMEDQISKKWQWDYKSEEFSVNYLGHILHYVEGMIMEIRDKQIEKGKIS